ncbi:hypothetical protein CR513_38169, partial [Mucuna pruriens]
MEGRYVTLGITNFSKLITCIKKGIEKNIWNKISIFFDLPYLCKLDVRHCMNVMHVEKNVCDSVIDMLLNIQGNIKDNMNTRLDMVINPEKLDKLENEVVIILC